MHSLSYKIIVCYVIHVPTVNSFDHFVLYNVQNSDMSRRSVFQNILRTDTYTDRQTGATVEVPPVLKIIKSCKML